MRVCHHCKGPNKTPDDDFGESGYGTHRLRRPVCKHFRCWRLTGGAAARPILLSLTQTGITEISQSQTRKSYLAEREHERKYKWSSAAHRNHLPLHDLGHNETAGALRIIP